MPAITAYTIASQLLECALSSIEGAGLPHPCRVCVTAGEITWDQCSGGGQLIMGINRIYYSNTFPLELTGESTGATNPVCGPAMAVVDLTLSLMRCAPPIQPGNPPRPPTCAAMDASAREIVLDSYYMRKGVLCCLRDLQRSLVATDYRISAANIDGPLGDCVGNELSILVGMIDG